MSRSVGAIEEEIGNVDDEGDRVGQEDSATISLLSWLQEKEGLEGSSSARRSEALRGRFALRSLRAGRTSFTGQLLLVLFVGAICWGMVSAGAILAWVAVVLVAARFRTAYPRRVRQRDGGTDELRRALLLAAIASAVAWSWGLLLFLPALDLPRLFLTVAVISAMITASAITMAADRRAFFSFSGILLATLVLAILLHGTDSVHWLGVAFVVADGAWVAYVFRGTHRAVRLELGYALDLEAKEDQLERERSFLSALLESFPDAVVVLHRDGLIVGVNPGFEEMFGWSPEEAVGRDVFKLLVPPDDREEINTRIANLMDRGVTQVRTAQRLGKDGRKVWTRISAANIQGQPDLAVIQYSDVTPLKETEEELERAKELAEAANQAKSEFLATMSHEIRTPMNAIIGMADLLSETDLSATQRDYVEVFRTAGDTLLTLINQVLDLSKIESGHLELVLRDFDLRELVDRTAQVFAIPAHKKGVELAARVDPEVPRWVRGDPDRLRQVLVNLIGNAVKFTDEGEVVLDIRPGEFDGASEAPSPDRIPLRIEVRDTGAGIPEERKSAIFERFTQADSSTTRKYGGTGLGLTISKALVSLMDGQMGVESEVGEGSTFYFELPLPLGTPQEPDREGTPGADIEGLRILVVDDNATNRLILQEILLGWGAHPVAVSGGPEALEALDREEKGSSAFDVVLLDGQMPGMDGFELAERIRQDPDLDGATLLMLTSSGDHARDVQRARELGIESYLVKPVRRPDLLAAILSVLGSVTKEESAGEARPEFAPTQGHRVLLVEDTAENQMLVEAYVAKSPHELHAVDRGQKAIDAYRADPSAFDLIFMDIQMPGLDGYEATRAIREIEEESGLDRVPIVALTAHALESERRKSEAAGCDAHLTKPIKKKELLDAIDQYSRPGATSVPSSADATAEGGS